MADYFTAWNNLNDALAFKARMNMDRSRLDQEKLRDQQTNDYRGQVLKMDQKQFDLQKRAQEALDNYRREQLGLQADQQMFEQDRIMRRSNPFSFLGGLTPPVEAPVVPQASAGWTGPIDSVVNPRPQVTAPQVGGGPKMVPAGVSLNADGIPSMSYKFQYPVEPPKFVDMQTPSGQTATYSVTTKPDGTKDYSLLPQNLQNQKAIPESLTKQIKGLNRAKDLLRQVHDFYQIDPDGMRYDDNHTQISSREAGGPLASWASAWSPRAWVDSTYLNDVAKARQLEGAGKLVFARGLLDAVGDQSESENIATRALMPQYDNTHEQRVIAYRGLEELVKNAEQDIVSVLRQGGYSPEEFLDSTPELKPGQLPPVTRPIDLSRQGFWGPPPKGNKWVEDPNRPGQMMEVEWKD